MKATEKWMGWLGSAWNRFFFEPVGAVDLGLSRAFFYGLALAYYLPQDWSEWGTVSTEFWMPTTLFKYLSVPLLAAPHLVWVQRIFKTALLLSAVGLWTRPAMIVSFFCGAYLLGLPHNFGQIQHFDTLPVLVFGILACSRAGDAFSIDAWRRTQRGTRKGVVSSGEYRWPVRTIWVTTSIIFFAAGFSKWRHSGLEWILSDNLGTLLVRHQYHLSDGEPLTAWGPAIAAHPWAARGLAAIAIFTETLYPLALFSRRARAVLVPAGLGFLVGIRALMGPTFEAFVICNVFWVPWSWIVNRRYLRLEKPIPVESA
jgi:hypothetical protein